ncbi:MAG: VanW family protein [Oscillochloridaceae bacterium]|nr:VanW family protein [Chloroflexaceae bacterium]MDW8389443.1 VanW family protein [Oscillochloridaceae bacterium]
MLCRHSLILTLVAAILAAFAPAPLARAQTARPALPVLEAGDHVVEEPFRSFILAHGGLEWSGQPLSAAFYDAEAHAYVQYFTYVRLERRGDRVELASLGRLYTADRQDETPFRPVAPAALDASERVFIAATGHTLGGAFAWYHGQHGGAALLGHPISEEFYETQPDGSRLLVQYFERMRLSYHPEHAGSDKEVQRAPLGAWLVEAMAPAAALAPQSLKVLASASMRYHAGSGSGANIELAAARLNGAILAPGTELSFLRTLGGISAARGFRPGPGIVGGQVVENIVGGGVCIVATLLYRAAWEAGLPVTERRGHSRWLATFADRPGLDAAVADPGLDLRIRNDTGAPLYLVVTARGGNVTLSLWGRGDGRAVTLGAPQVSRGASLTVLNTRVVRAGSGALLRSERVVTMYRLAG